MGSRVWGEGKHLRERVRERVREGVNVREGESAGEGERELVLIVVGPKTNITSSTGLTGWDNQSDRSGPS